MKTRKFTLLIGMSLFAALAMPIAWQRRTTHHPITNPSTRSTSSSTWERSAVPQALSFRETGAGPSAITAFLLVRGDNCSSQQHEQFLCLLGSHRCHSRFRLAEGYCD